MINPADHFIVVVTCWPKEKYDPNGRLYRQALEHVRRNWIDYSSARCERIDVGLRRYVARGWIPAAAGARPLIPGEEEGLVPSDRPTNNSAKLVALQLVPSMVFCGLLVGLKSRRKKVL